MEAQSSINPKPKWERQPMNNLGGGGNELLRHPETKDFVISYQPNQYLGIDGWASTQTALGETAVCDRRTDTYYVLNGDWREQFEAIYLNGVEACIEFFYRHPEAHSCWSTHELPNAAT